MSNTRVLITVGDSGATRRTPSAFARFKAPQRKANEEQTPLGDERLIRLKQAVVCGDYRVNTQRIALKLLKRS